jgi:DNA polymerase-3 subunit delta'
MALVPLYGHQALRDRLADCIRRGALPQSLLLHGPTGVGKQRLALWVAQALLCERADPPCGQCRHCRFALELTHPDLLWVFPRPRPKDGDRDPDEVRADLAAAAQERLEAHGLYAPPSGSEGIFVATVRAMVHQAAITPAIARRKVFVVGDADRLVSQEGADQASNAFLKLLEEPPDDTFIILTSSAVGALLPTIRSRTAAVRVPTLPDDDVRAFVKDPTVKDALDRRQLPPSVAERLTLAAGTPGLLFALGDHSAANATASRFLDAASGNDRAALLRAAFLQGSTGARGSFSDALDALTVKLHARARTAATRGDDRLAVAATRAALLVEDAKLLTQNNLNPQLVSVRLLLQMREELA